IRVCHVSYSNAGLVLGHDVEERGFLCRIYVLDVDIKVVALLVLLRDEQVATCFIDKLQDRILRICLSKCWEVQTRVQALQHAAGKDPNLDVRCFYLLRWAITFDDIQLARDDGAQGRGTGLIGKSTT